MVWLGSGTKMTWLGLGKHCGLGKMTTLSMIGDLHPHGLKL